MSKYVIDKTTLTAIGDAVRAKGNTEDKILVSDLATAISNLPTGGDEGPTEEMRTFTGDVSYLFANGNFVNWQDKYPFIINDVTRAERTFVNTPNGKDLSKITINTKSYPDVNDGVYVGNIFDSVKVDKLPTINGRITLFNSSMFYSCRYITDDEMRKFFYNPDLEFSWGSSNNRLSNPGLSNVFYYCVSLRNINDILLYIHQYFRDNPPQYSSSLSDYYSSVFYNCDAIDEICNVPIFKFSNHGPNTSNIFSSTFSYCGRVKNITFATDNGTPYIKQWKNQTLELHNRTGWNSSYSTFSGYNNGITADKEVKDDATYQALKNDPDWFATKVEYSRYNHDSAVNTINSLPDTSAYLASAGGTNTIKFKGQAGALTDGGAINTLTEAEIAVATAKGWTVTFA